MHHGPRLNERWVPLLWFEAADHHREWCVRRDVELGADLLATGCLIEPLEIHTVVDAADRCTVAPFRNELVDDGVAHRNQAIDLGGNALQ